jgi:hypothetical protein
MNGWKTLVGGIAAIGCGMYLLVETPHVEFGMSLMSLGLMGLGLGHKLDKVAAKLVLFLAFGFLLTGASTATAAMTCVDDGIRAWPGSKDHRLSMTCTFDTTPGTAVAAFPSTIQAVINKGAYVYQFTIKPGATGPTDNSDLQILDASGATIIAAAGNGANVIDNATVTSVIYGDGPTAGSTNHAPKGDGEAWTTTVTNNAVNSSSFKLIMKVGEK